MALHDDDFRYSGERKRHAARPTTGWRWRPSLTLAIVLVWSACSLALGRQEWDRGSYGPVVPHETFPADCSLCHVSASGTWYEIREDFTFDHEAETGVALAGAHRHAACLMCHNDRGPVAQFAARGCGGCHEDVHRGLQGSRCESCHDDQTSWRLRSAVAMHDRTRFPLVGAHAAVACFRCHEGATAGNFTGEDPQCASCHAEDLARAVSPDHTAAGFADCDRCHRPVAWTPARFAHPASFPLTGGHGGRLCNACHTSPGTFSGLPTDCLSCHMDDRQRARPDHSGFPVTCMDCHTTAGWSGRFAHRFPLTRDHALDCSACHTPAAPPPSFSCIDCHDHSRERMDDEHDEVTGYVYSSPSCLQCHPTGRR